MTPTPPQGLTAAEVAARVARGEVNAVRRSGRAEYLDIVRRNTLTLLNALVTPAAAALFFYGKWQAGVAVTGMALTNTVLGLAQELRAKRLLDKLTLLSQARARVRRDGQVQDVAADDVVRGDLVLLAPGDSVIADGTVRASRYLEVDEALLTGESDPVPRQPGDQLLSGSFAVAGDGEYQADRVGVEAFAQRTAREARTYRHTPSPLQLALDRLVRLLTAVAVLMCISYFALQPVRGYEPGQLAEMCAATITAMIPQGLVLMATLALLVGAVRMSARGAIVQRLNAVEAMAGVDVLCMDKTGTLTTNHLRLDRVVVVTDDRAEEEVRRRLRLFASASVDREGKGLTAVRTALGEAAGELVDQLPFKSQNRYSAVRVRADGTTYGLALGACEALRGHLRPADTDRWEQAWKALLPTGLRLLMFAEVSGEGRPFGGSLEGLALAPLALVALSDELRPEARDVLRALAGQGIGFKILSGDNPETVRATVAPLGAGAAEPALRALADGPVVMGAELADAPDPASVIRDRAVFGRISPGQKVEVIAALKQQGRQVAMIGDGVNDVLPIKNAHLGIAMGDGSRASKAVSGLVLQTNDFGLLPQTLDEGRRILRNLSRASKLFLVKNVYTVLLVVVGTLALGLPFPFLPQQVTLLNLLTIGTPALLLTLSRQPAGPLRGVFLREVASFAARSGVVIGAAGLVLLLLTRDVWHEDERAQQTMLLSAVVLLGLVTVLRALTDGEAGSASGEPHMLGVALGAVGVYVLVLYVRPAAAFFQLAPLSALQWARVLGVAAPACLVAWGSDRLAAVRR